MKLKYYLRGLGMGILFATIVMIVHSNNLPAEKVIKQAEKLGMVMPEDTEDKNGLWGNKESTEDVSESQNTSPLNTEETSENQNTSPLNTEETSEKQTVPPVNTEDISESQVIPPFNTEEVQGETQLSMTEQISDVPADEQQSLESEEITYIKIKISSNSTAEKVCRTLYKNGLIENEDDFHAYLIGKRYTHSIRKGTFEIPMGATYEEICEIIIYQ